MPVLFSASSLGLRSCLCIFDRAPIDRCDEIGRIFIFEIFEFSRFSKIEKSISALFVDPEGKKTLILRFFSLEKFVPKFCP